MIDYDLRPTTLRITRVSDGSLVSEVPTPTTHDGRINFGALGPWEAGAYEVSIRADFCELERMRVEVP